MDQKKIGLFIQECRRKKKLTQAELGEKIGVTEKSISNWENGRNMPDLSLFKPLCEVLDISVSELLNGEKIVKSKVLDKSNDTLINTLKISDKNKKKSNKIIKSLLFTLICFIIIFLIFIFNIKIYKEIDIYSVVVSLSDEYKLKKHLSYSENSIKRDIYYYGIDTTQLCDLKDNCHELKIALNYKQTNLENIEKYLDSQFSLGNINRYMLYDGGTIIYENDRYSVILCNTMDGNKDVYFGKDDMVESLDGEYCGHEKNPTKKFIRTYHIISVLENKNDLEYIDVTLRGINNDVEIVTLHKSNNILVGRNYEFSFYTFEEFEDTIENIFKYSTFLEARETDKLEWEFVNEDIYVNKELDNGAELNEVENVSMEIEKGTLTKTGATIIITDLNGNKYSYGDPFWIERFENGTWKEVENICDNCMFNMIAYGVDINGKLRLEHNWSYMYGELKPGKYRLIKGVLPNLDRPVTEEDEKYISVEFELE